MDKMRSIWIWFELDKNASVLHGLQLFECCRRWKWTWRKCTISRDSAAPKAKYFIVAWELLTDNRSVSNFTIRTHWNKICEACFVFEKELKKVQPKTCPTFCTSIHEKQLTINKPNIVFAAISCYFIEQAIHYHNELKKIHQGVQNNQQIKLKGRTPSFYSVSSTKDMHSYKSQNMRDNHSRFKWQDLYYCLSLP